MRGMQRGRPLLRIATPLLLVVCITLLVVHGLTGHAHVDVLAAVPVTDHVPGDDHHEVAGGSCEIARTPASSTHVPLLASVLPPVAFLEAPSRTAAGSVDEAKPAVRPPRFLLHAALLI